MKNYISALQWLYVLGVDCCVERVLLCIFLIERFGTNPFIF